jgi:cysteine desulfurase
VIYLDSNATTQIDPAVVESMLPYLSGHWENPSSPNRGGRLVRRALEAAREQLASLLNAKSSEVIFTSGGTEGCNAVIESARTLLPHRMRLVVGATEHPAVMEPAMRWSRCEGELSVIPVDEEGRLNLEELKSVLTLGDTALVSIMWANNETGVLAPMREIVETCHEFGALIHSDAVQVCGKEQIDLKSVRLDFLTLSGHKFHAPKGVGVLFVSDRVRFNPFILGGGQEGGLRSGTENVASIIGLGKAAEFSAQHLVGETHGMIAEMRDAFERHILHHLPGTRAHGAAAPRLINTSNLYFPGIDSAGLLILLDEKGIACSAGSACHSSALHPSATLKAMGVSREEAGSTLRFSFSRFNTLSETLSAADQVCKLASKLRTLSDEESGPVRMTT